MEGDNVDSASTPFLKSEWGFLFGRRFVKRAILIIIPFLILTLSLSVSHAQTYKVKRVIDGDALLLTNGEYVRLIGVDTPETKHPQKPVEYFGKEACQFTKRMVEGKEVRLEYVWATIEREPKVTGMAPCKLR
jgi:endonuclease YncB( thermonuclease family)